MQKSNHLYSGNNLRCTCITISILMGVSQVNHLSQFLILFLQFFQKRIKP